MTDALACDNFGVDGKNCLNLCIPGFIANGDLCEI